MSESQATFPQWACLELMGHRRLAGHVTEQEIAGGSFLRIDIPDPNGEPDVWIATQYYSPQAVYGITPVDEATARLCAAEWIEPPVNRWTLRRMLEPGESEIDEE